jgi:hypothetical protein
VGDWYDWTKTEFDPNADTYTIKTNQGEEYVFDLATGRKLRTKSDWDIGVAIIVVCVPTLILGLCRHARSKHHAGWRQRWWQVSLGEAFLLATVASVLLTVARFSTTLSISVASIGFGGGGIAQFVTRGRLSWWLGGFVAVYGTFIGLIIFSTLGAALIMRLSLPSVPAIGLLVGCCAAGWLTGALVGGRVAKRCETHTPLVIDAR